jgi:hypothetical protein
MRAMPAKSSAARALAEAESSPLPRRPIRFGQVGEDEPRRRSGCGWAVGVRVDGEVGRVDARSPGPV